MDSEAARGSAKDQTYFLFGLTQEQLARTLFPLGHMTKPEVREVARQHGLALAEKPDSQEICFIPGGDYKQFLTAYLEEQGEADAGDRGRTGGPNGEVIGQHEGISNFTVGQRKGLERAVAVAALCAANRSGEPSRDGGRRCGTGHAHAARRR